MNGNWKNLPSTKVAATPLLVALDPPINAIKPLKKIKDEFNFL